jgi:hypothetical protein
MVRHITFSSTDSASSLRLIFLLVLRATRRGMHGDQATNRQNCLRRFGDETGVAQRERETLPLLGTYTDLTYCTFYGVLLPGPQEPGLAP